MTQQASNHDVTPLVQPVMFAVNEEQVSHAGGGNLMPEMRWDESPEPNYSGQASPGTLPTNEPLVVPVMQW